MPHLFVDISSHGFGHLAQTAPILSALQDRRPNLRLTVRCGLPEAKVRARIRGDFAFIADSTDFGFAMLNAVSIDAAETERRYRAFHADWSRRVAAEARLLADCAADLVLTDVAYLPLAGAAQAGIPALTMCSLNWAELFAHFFGDADWANPIHAEIHAAYASAEHFLRLIPAMPMAALGNARPVGPVASLGRRRRDKLAERLACDDDRIVLIAFGGVAHELPVEHWPQHPGIHWLVPQDWGVERADINALEPLKLPITDVLASVDAVLTKPGYGTFTEAACNGTAVLYQRRTDWPEQDCLIEWLEQHARCREVGADALRSGDLADTLTELWRLPAPTPPRPTGIAEVAELLDRRLSTTR
ncbi:hypothetical protein [Propionivibrio dicarboxylicus]|uniref:UDP:flavonoid glycosyltransferase YjiC, YdhE family n=1 Tax=Propionivibrio dicarboxylicus TaxID=83767 RepID=A0A1G7VU23_9RHOO|nr:hypothetical protein [Propionivibrio dicarboxylicus]SDG63273.1 hypothetical protein SAMN05660652_00306 [Propionivibrio dicarboxylicus]